MSARDHWRRLKLASLRREPERFSFSWPGGADELRRSLAEEGQLRPLLVQDSGEGPILLSGHRRVVVLESLGLEEAWVRPAVAKDSTKFWDLLLKEQRHERELNPVEVGLYLERRQADTGESWEQLAQAVCPQLGVPPRRSALDDYLWVAGLPQRHRDSFALGRRPFHAVRMLARSAPGDVEAMLDLLGDAPVGVNKFSELVRWMQECAWGTGESVARWIVSAGLEPLRGQPEALRSAVRSRRFPQLAAWESSFDEDLRTVPLPPRVRVNHAPGFEGGRLTCTLSFASLGELDNAGSELLEALRAGHLAPLAKYLG